MKSKLPAAIIISFSLCNGAGGAESEYEYAEVVEARPVYQVVEVSVPVEQCREEQIAIDRYRSKTPILISTIIGGAIGHAVGHHKSSRRAGAAVGAILGHSVGRDIIHAAETGRGAAYETVQFCDTVHERHEEERLVGYRVTYVYNGNEYSVRTDSDPGERIRVRVVPQPVL